MHYVQTIISVAACFTPLTGMNDVSLCILAAGLILLAAAFRKTG